MTHRALITGLILIITTAPIYADKPIELKQGPQLFLDDYLIAEQSNLHRVINQPKRLPKPVVTGPEDKCFQPYMTIVSDPPRKNFRIWYGVPESSNQSHLGYMESDDGIHWIRPHRVLKDPGHIQFGVSILDEGRDFPKKEQRYKYGWYAEGGLQIAVSPNGLDWTKLQEERVVEHSHDINCIFRDPIRNRYMAMLSTYEMVPEVNQKRRIPAESVSDDLIHWKEPWKVVTLDEKDKGETQFYCMGGLIARGPLLIGMLRVLRDDLPADEGGDVKGLGYTVLIWSHDGEHWERDRQPFLPRNPEPKSWDHAMTWADCQLIVGDETFIYYGGYARGHKVERYTERQIGLARMDLDRYVSHEAGSTEGLLRTKTVTLTGNRLSLNANVKGECFVRILDENGKPLPGLDWTDAEPVKGNSIHHALRWKNDALPPLGAPIQLEIKLKDTKLYALNVS